MKTVTIIKPRYQETDQMGVIHHSVYPVWYEVGRVDYLEQIGMPYEEINQMGYHMAIIEMGSTFKKPAFFGKPVFLHTSLVESSKVKLKLIYEMYNENDELIHEGFTVLVWLNKELKPINIAKENIQLYQLFNSLL